MQKTKIKDFLDELNKKYETKDFIKNDPIQFPHRYKRREDVEIVAFLSAIFAYGNRKIFCAKLQHLFDFIGEKPLEFVVKGDFDHEFLKNFDYRFSKGIDLIQILSVLSDLYQKSSLMEFFEYGYSQKKDVWTMLQVIIDYFYSKVTLPVTKGFYHLLPNPEKNSAMKRMNMFLRWMVRDGEVDFGLWKFIDKSELLIPLDTHVARISRELGLLTKNSNDYFALMELMESLCKFDKFDPSKYDFSLFGYGIEH